MHFFAPERPRMGEAPMYIGPDGQQIAALQDLQVAPQPDGSFDVAVMLRCAHRGFKWYHARIESAGEIGALCQSYIDNPEEALQLIFKYDFVLVQKPTNLSLEDLGL